MIPKINEKNIKKLIDLFDNKKNGIVMIPTKEDHHAIAHIIESRFSGVFDSDIVHEFYGRLNKRFPFAIRISNGGIKEYFEPQDIQDIKIAYTIEYFVDGYLKDGHLEKCCLPLKKEFTCACCNKLHSTEDSVYKGFMRNETNYKLVLFCEECAKKCASDITEITSLGNGKYQISTWKKNYLKWYQYE